MAATLTAEGHQRIRGREWRLPGIFAQVEVQTHWRFTAGAKGSIDSTAHPVMTESTTPKTAATDTARFGGLYSLHAECCGAARREEFQSVLLPGQPVVEFVAVSDKFCHTFSDPSLFSLGR